MLGYEPPLACLFFIFGKKARKKLTKLYAGHFSPRVAMGFAQTALNVYPRWELMTPTLNEWGSAVACHHPVFPKIPATLSCHPACVSSIQQRNLLQMPEIHPSNLFPKESSSVQCPAIIDSPTRWFHCPSSMKTFCSKVIHWKPLVALASIIQRILSVLKVIFALDLARFSTGTWDTMTSR